MDFWGHVSGGPKWHFSDFSICTLGFGFWGSAAGRGACKLSGPLQLTGSIGVEEVVDYRGLHHMFRASSGPGQMGSATILGCEKSAQSFFE